MEKTCKQCGKTLPIDMFPIQGAYRKNICKDCVNSNKREWRKRRIRSDEERAKDSLRCALKREENKANTGRVYRNRREAENRRAYAKRYEEEHKNDPHHKEMQSRCHKNYRQRKKIMEEVEMLDDFF